MKTCNGLKGQTSVEKVISRLVHTNRRQRLSDLTVALNKTIPVTISETIAETTVKRTLKRLAFKRCSDRKTITISAQHRTKPCFLVT